MEEQNKKLTDEKDILEVHQEELEINKESVETGNVKIHTSVISEDVISYVPLLSEKISVVRIPMNEEVSETPEIRYEDNVTIIPVIKEVAVVTTKLILVEEIRITKETHEHIEKIESTLRSENVEVERIEREGSE